MTERNVPAREREDRQLAITSWAATLTPLLVLVAHGSLWASGVIGIYVAYRLEQFGTGILGVLCLTLALFAPRLS